MKTVDRVLGNLVSLVLKINGDLRKENEILCSLNIVYMSGLSLVLLKADCD